MKKKYSRKKKINVFANLHLLAVGKSNLTKRGIISQSLRVEVVLALLI